MAREMAGSSFKFQSGPIRLGESNDEVLDRASTGEKRMPISTLVFHGCTAGVSVSGISSLLAAYIIRTRDSTIQRSPDDFFVVAVLLSASISWSLFVLLDRLSKPLLELSTAKDALTSLCLTYFSGMGFYCLNISWSADTCDYLTLLGLLCACVVAFLQVIQFMAPAWSNSVHLDDQLRSGQYFRNFFKSDDLSEIVMCFISACLSTIGFCLLVSNYLIAASYLDGYRGKSACSGAGFDGTYLLTTLLTISLLWFNTNLLTTIMSGRKHSNRTTSIFEFSLGISMIGTSVYCLIAVNDFRGTGLVDGECSSFWMPIKIRYLTAIVLAFIIGQVKPAFILFVLGLIPDSLIYTSIFLNRVRPRLLFFRDRTLLYRLNGPGGLKFLHSQAWTDDQMVSFLNMKGLTEEARDNVVSLLYQIHGEELSNDDPDHDDILNAETKQGMAHGRNLREEQLIPIYDAPRPSAYFDLEAGFANASLQEES
ncbi:hypothetical protein G7Y89_g7468 [Cudoniella acicularis]|uniref:Uncharacterized protein n=1 Tax=Cudoniella acicularis TaxID=354080 RepID=A0A8H4W4J0_9HELO|nr:hypothetical protein G7Y89_g7468 [Cudoniella acicularis]